MTELGLEEKTFGTKLWMQKMRRMQLKDQKEMSFDVEKAEHELETQGELQEQDSQH